MHAGTFHSQLLVTLNVSATLSGLKAHREELKAAQSAFRSAAASANMLGRLRPITFDCSATSQTD